MHDASWKEPPEYRDSGGGRPQFGMPSLTPGVRFLLFANAAVFLFMFLLYIPSGTEGWAKGLLRWLGISPGLWLAAFPLAPIWQLVTWGFVHSLAQPSHILFNMLALYFLGTMLEDVIGRRRFLATFVSALLVSGAATLAFGLLRGPDPFLAELGLPLSQQYPPTIGASGAVLCIVVAMAVLRPNTRIIFILFPITLRTLAIGYVALDVINLLLATKSAGASDVSYIAHIAGAGWGFVVAKQGWIWRDPVAGLTAMRERSREKQVAGDEVRLDALLSKINREGIHALSASEKAFLKRASKRS